MDSITPHGTDSLAALIASLGALIITILNWLDKHRDAAWKREMESQQAQWRREDELHRQRLEELALRASEKGDEVKQAVLESKEERRQQLIRIEEKADRAYDAANHINEKLAKSGVRLNTTPEET